MSITTILNDKEMSAEAKLTSVAETVTIIRAAYGNAETEIPSVKVYTSSGNLPFTHLENDSKVEVLLGQAMSIKAQAIAYVEENEGTVLNKKVEELIATNTFFANISTKSEFEYL
jgi:hypothetical protein